MQAVLAVLAWQCCLLLVGGVSHSTVCGSCHHGNGLCLASPIPALSSCLWGGGGVQGLHTFLPTPHPVVLPCGVCSGCTDAEEDTHHIRGGRGRGRSQLLLSHVCTQVERLCWCWSYSVDHSPSPVRQLPPTYILLTVYVCDYMLLINPH